MAEVIFGHILEPWSVPQSPLLFRDARFSHGSPEPSPISWWLDADPNRPFQAGSKDAGERARAGGCFSLMVCWVHKGLPSIVRDLSSAALNALETLFSEIPCRPRAEFQRTIWGHNRSVEVKRLGSLLMEILQSTETLCGNRATSGLKEVTISPVSISPPGSDPRATDQLGYCEH